MDFKQYLNAGQLMLAIEQLNSEVKSHAADMRLRISLFELLCVTGDYERAMRQLDVIGQLDAKATVGLQVYRNALVAEDARSRLVTGGLLPTFLAEPSRSALLRVEAFNRLREGCAAEARGLLEQAAETEDPVPGTIDGQEFADISDGDALLGPMLELIVNDRYVWLPLAQIRQLAVGQPKTMRDLIWIPTNIACTDGSAFNAFVPVLYRGSATHSDDQIKLGRATDWQDAGAGLMRGFGQRMFFIDNTERAILQLGSVNFGT